MFEIKI